MAKEMTKGKKLLISFLTIVMIVCIIVDAWYICLLRFGPKKEVDTTYNVGEVQLSDGTSKHFMEINYFTNRNKNGLEMFEIKFNYLLDEERNAFYSQGLQYVANTAEQGIEWEYRMDQDSGVTLSSSSGVFRNGAIYSTNADFATWGFWQNTATTAKYNYASSDDYIHTLISGTEINNNSQFKITLGQGDDTSIYKIKFKGVGVVEEYAEHNFEKYEKDPAQLFVRRVENQKVPGSNIFVSGYFNNSFYAYADIDTMAHTLYEQIQSMSGEIDTSIVFEMADLFEYYKCTDDANGIYESTYKTSDLLDFVVSNYYDIKVNFHADGATRASDSLFNCIHGSQTFNLNGDYTSKEYFYGESIVKCDIYDFDLVNVSENYYCLKLNQNFLNNFLQYKESVKISVVIDLDVLESNNMKFLTFATDSGLENFEIAECYTTQTVNGEVVKTEVAV